MLTVSKILVLKKLPLFRDMTPDLLSCLAKITKERVVEKSHKKTPKCIVWILNFDSYINIINSNFY